MKPNILDAFEYKTVECSEDGTLRQPAWCNGELAAIDFRTTLKKQYGIDIEHDMWTIMHLHNAAVWNQVPVFRSIEFCAAAILELNKLSPTWIGVDKKPLRDKWIPILAQYGGYPLQAVIGKPDAPPASPIPKLNGFRRH